MKRPEFITNEDISRWSEIIDNDPTIPKELVQQAIVREVFYAGLYLSEQLEKLECPAELLVRIQFSAGKYSFGRDPWAAHLEILDLYKNNQLKFEKDQIDDSKIN